MIEIYRIEMPKNNEGYYSQHDFKDSKMASLNKAMVNALYIETESPCPAQDFLNTHNYKHYETEGIKFTYEQWDEIFKFNQFWESSKTRYGCLTLDSLANTWLGANKKIIDMLVRLGYQLVKYTIEEKYCYFLKNQVMFNSLKAKGRKTLHLKDTLMKEFKYETV